MFASKFKSIKTKIPVPYFILAKIIFSAQPLGKNVKFDIIVFLKVHCVSLWRLRLVYDLLK